MAERIELAKAYVQVIPTTEGIKDKLSDSFDKEGKDSGNKFTDGMKGVLVGAAKGVGVAAGAIAVAVGKVVKDATSAYANFEQLSGGIETLFGEGGRSLEEYAAKVGKTVDEAKADYDNLLSAQETVMNNAAEAYKTAGLSANEYMETVTSFSAALINSVGGDTQKAAELSNMAITDMSDNANKMGTSMESLQNAYTGFARGNFTMLDNLSLGFAGTKEGMQQLLDKATELSGVEYDISSYADIVEAIHVVQSNMDITGTTAKEASTTITGSLNTVKGAWQNLLTGLGDKDADMSTLTTNLAESLATALKNIAPVVTEVLGSISEVVSPLLDWVIDELPGLFSDFLPDFVSTVIDLLVDVTTKLLDSLPELLQILIDGLLSEEMITKLVGGLIEMVMSLVTHLPEIIAVLVEALPVVIENVINGLVNNLPLLIEGLINLVTQLVIHLPEIILGLIQAIPMIITSIVNALASLPDKLKEVGSEAFTKMVDAFKELPGKLKEKAGEALNKFIEAWANIKEKIEGIVKKIKEPFDKFVKKIKDIGKNIVKGLWNGINDKYQWIKDKVGGFVKGIGDKIKGFFGINSPSRLMAEYGRYIDEGLALGIEKNANLPEKAMLDMADDMTDINIPTTVSSSAMLTASAPTQSAYTDRLDTIEKLLKQIATEGKDIYLDGTTLVGGTAKKMNAALDKIDYSRKRGVTNYAY